MKLQLQDISGQVIEEKEIVLGENDTLVMMFDEEKISLANANEVFNVIKEGLRNNTDLIGIPSSIDLKVIKKQ